MSELSASVLATHSVRLTAIGCDVHINIAGNLAGEAHSAIRRAWSWCLPPAEASAPPVIIEVFCDSDPGRVENAAAPNVLATTDLAEMMHYLSQMVTVRCIDQRAGELLMLHAGALADPDSGRAVAVVAASGTGKTTFIRTLGAARVYLTDETVVVRDDNTVLPYPKPLSLSDPAAPEFKQQLEPSQFGLIQATRTCQLAALWVLERSPAPVAPRAESLPKLDALMVITPQASHLPSMSAPLQRLSTLFDSVGGLTKVTYHEASDLEPMLARALLEAV